VTDTQALHGTGVPRLAGSAFGVFRAGVQEAWACPHGLDAGPAPLRRAGHSGACRPVPCHASPVRVTVLHAEKLVL